MPLFFGFDGSLTRKVGGRFYKSGGRIYDPLRYVETKSFNPESDLQTEFYHNSLKKNVYFLNEFTKYFVAGMIFTIGYYWLTDWQ